MQLPLLARLVVVHALLLPRQRVPLAAQNLVNGGRLLERTLGHHLRPHLLHVQHERVQRLLHVAALLLQGRFPLRQRLMLVAAAAATTAVVVVVVVLVVVVMVVVRVMVAVVVITVLITMRSARSVMMVGGGGRPMVMMMAGRAVVIVPGRGGF